MTQETAPLQNQLQGESCMVGNLETWPLMDLLLWLNKTGRSAMVRVGAGLDAGVIFFHKGHLFRCEWGPHTGEQALWGLLHVNRGIFSLIQRDVPTPRPNIHHPTEQLLLHYAVARDEQGRATA